MSAYVKYIQAVNTYQAKYPALRYGQVLFNVLYIHHRNLAYIITNERTDIDPFYDEKCVNSFLAWLRAQLS